MKMNILVINGPNLNLLGTREPDVYGSMTYQELCDTIKTEAKEISENLEVSFYQSNIEGEIIDAIHSAKDTCNGMVINPGAYTHYSYAIRDALDAVAIPAVEVHISNIHKREEFRHKSVTASACIGQIAGLGVFSYVAAIHHLERQLGGNYGRNKETKK